MGQGQGSHPQGKDDLEVTSKEITINWVSGLGSEFLVHKSAAMWYNSFATALVLISFPSQAMACHSCLSRPAGAGSALKQGGTNPSVSRTCRQGTGASLLGVTLADPVVSLPSALPSPSALLEFPIALIYRYTVCLGRQLCCCNGSDLMSSAVALLEICTIHLPCIAPSGWLRLSLRNKKRYNNKSKKDTPNLENKIKIIEELLTLMAQGDLWRRTFCLWPTASLFLVSCFTLCS